MTPARPDRWLHRVLVAAARAALFKSKPRPLLTKPQLSRAAIRAKAEQLRNELAAADVARINLELAAKRTEHELLAFAAECRVAA